MISDKKGRPLSFDYNSTEQSLANELFRRNYDDLVVIARARRRRSSPNHTLATIDILHDSFIRLNKTKTWDTRDHFINAAALAIRHVIIDYARRKTAAKRVTLTSQEQEKALMLEYWETSEQIVEMSDLMEKLKTKNSRWMRIVDARYFCGFTEDETAGILKISPRTVRRDWQDARAWMAERILA